MRATCHTFTLRRAVALGGSGVVLALLGLPVATTACFGNACQGDFVAYGETPSWVKSVLPGKGRYIDDNTWESSPLFATEEERVAANGGPVAARAWVPFTHKRTLDFWTGDDRYASDVEVYISVGQRQGPGETTNGVQRIENFTLASGNLAKIFVSFPGIVTVFNDSCADFYTRTVVHFPPRIPRPDAGSDAGDASLTDAGATDTGVSDAPSDSPATD
jgi:hypothetical protein